MTRWVRRLINVFRRARLERELDAELRVHLALETERNLRAGLPPAEARRLAYARLGGVEQVKERFRETHPFRWLGGFWLDVKLGLRILVKHPGLTCVAGFALAVGIPLGLLPMHATNALEAPPPFDEAGQILVLKNFNVATSRWETPSVYDFVQWREQLTTFDDLAVTTRGASYNVLSEDGRAGPVRGAEITAAAFEIVRVPPRLGRPLIPADEVIGAPRVVVVSYDLWQSRLDGDPDVVGRSLRIGGVPRTVVGVMPEGFLFPVQEQLWLPLPMNAFIDEHESRGTRMLIFGRLADGVSPDEAQAELTAAGRRLASAFPAMHEHLRQEVTPFTIGLFDAGAELAIAFYLFQILALLVLVVACANVGMLIFSRTATRARELAVRTALGASRTRVISQLFTEALVLAVLAAGVGLVILDWVAPLLFDWALDVLPYWIDLGVSRTTVLWALSLAVLSAGLVSIVPALRVTGSAIQWNMQRTTAERAGTKFGGVSSALLVADVAVAVVAVGVAVGLSDTLTEATYDATSIEAEQFLSAELSIPGLEPEANGAPFAESEWEARLGATQQALVQRLAAEPGIRGVAVANLLPGMDAQESHQVELDGEPQPEEFEGPWVLNARVDIDFFDAFEHPILIGRGFALTDLGEDGTAVIVNTFFVDRVLGGRSAIGRRVRNRAHMGQEPGPWYEIVGVVGPLGMDVFNSGTAGLYRPLAPGASHPVRLAIHVGDDPEAFTPRLRALAGQVDPTAIISNPVALNEVFSANTYLMEWIKLGGGILIGILVVLSTMGIYALMSFTVGERTREIGIRIALGAQRNKIVFTVARRSLAQLGAGICIGMPIAGWILLELKNVGRIQTHSAFFLTVAVGVSVMTVIGALACTAPTLRVLRIMPTEALRDG